MEKVEVIEAETRLMDRNMILNMERCAEFFARMIEKYGQEVLAEIEAEKSGGNTDRNSVNFD